MDESEVERGMMTGAVLLESRLAMIRRQVGGAAASPRECEDCGDDIPEARLRAAPGARRCVDCQGRCERQPWN